MKEFKTIEEALNELYNKNELTYSNFINLPENKDKASLFVQYIDYQFDRFIKINKQINEQILIKTLNEFGNFEGAISKKRFVNLLTKISKGYSKVLKECYYPSQANALNNLEILLGTKNKELKRYLIEQLINYSTFDFPENKILYRVRDVECDKDVDNCWHTPFNARQYSYAGRFSSPGFPCLYLADSPETCCAEVGSLNEGYSRWLGEFKKKKKVNLGCLDLTIPKEEKIKNASSYELIQMILAYPLKILCTTYAEHKSDSFGEEYLFSQNLINLLNHPKDDNSGISQVTGIMYDSTKYKGGLNIALPAKSEKIPPYLNETYSTFLQNIFHHEKPYVIEKHESTKK